MSRLSLGLDTRAAAQELDRRASEAAEYERRGEDRRGTNGNGKQLLHGITNNRLAVAVLVLAFTGAYTWLTTVSEAREKVKVHEAAIADHANRLRPLEEAKVRDEEWKKGDERWKRDTTDLLNELAGRRRR